MQRGVAYAWALLNLKIYKLTIKKLLKLPGYYAKNLLPEQNQWISIIFNKDYINFNSKTKLINENKYSDSIIV